MIRILIDEKMLDDDRPEDAAKAYNAGWRIDEDYWWVRPIRESDPMEAAAGFIERRHVFFACADDASAFDLLSNAQG